MLSYFATQNSETVPISIIILTCIFIGVTMIGVVGWVYADYKRHKRPLLEADPSVDYSFFHHIKVVTIPLMSYRISFYIEKKPPRQKS